MNLALLIKGRSRFLSQKIAFRTKERERERERVEKVQSYRQLGKPLNNAKTISNKYISSSYATEEAGRVVEVLFEIEGKENEKKKERKRKESDT